MDRLSSERRGVLLVGGGQAALQMAVSLRDVGYDAPITIVGDEPRAPYQRPPLSKGLLKGTARPESIELRGAAFFDEQRIVVHAGEEVVDVVRDSAGGVARTASGRQVPFGSLVLATGARARGLDVPGADGPGVHRLRTAADAESLLRALSDATRIVVIGAGFIGLEVAATLRQLDRQVSVLESADRLLARAASPAITQALEARHRSAGIDLRLGVHVANIKRSGERVVGVSLASGEVVDADLVVVGVGAEPRTELARALGLTCERGIVVDELSLASDGATYAIGDCAAVLDPTPTHADGARLRLESVDNAVEQAKAAAATLAGTPTPYRSVPWFWSDQGEEKLQIVGLRRPDDVPVERPSEDPRRVVVGHFRQGVLVAAETLNAPADFMALKTIVAAGARLDPTSFADPACSLRALAKEARAHAISRD